ncbi:MFS transporter [Actinokineospora enzanensis]|uniref:MFS transporter n=1 Tax=Actinokineospora enzanensis TaxID=155975 RepID=UPI00146D3F18|nr:MFS transporter [Actinokineospora enzanensis]
MGLKSGMGGLGAVVRDRNAGAYLGTVVMSAFGTGAMILAAGVWVMSLTDNAGLAALVQVVMWLPTLAAPFVGTVVDRIGRHRAVLIWTMLITGALLTSLLLVNSACRLWLLFAVMFGYGLSYLFTEAAEAALLPSAVPTDLLGHVNSLRMAAQESSKLTAPLVGAGLFAAFGGGAVALLDAATFLAAALLCLLVRPVNRPIGPRAGSRVRDGLAYLRNSPLLRRLVLVASISMGLAGLSGSLTFALIDDGLGYAPAFAGVLTAAQGAGTVLYALGSGGLLRRVGPARLAALGVAMFALGALLRATGVVWLVIAGTALVGAGLPGPLIAYSTVLQSDTPPGLVARVASTASLISLAPSVLGQLLGVVLATAVDYRIPLAAVGVLALGLAARVMSAESPTRRRAMAPDGRPGS